MPDPTPYSILRSIVAQLQENEDKIRAGIAAALALNTRGDHEGATELLRSILAAMDEE